MTDVTIPFHERRRQQFLDEYSYEGLVPFFEEDVEWCKTGAAFPQRPNDDGLYNARYGGGIQSLQFTTYLYTGGEPFERMLQQLITTIELYEDALRLHPKALKIGTTAYPVFEIYEPENLFDLTKLASLTVLFSRPDLTRRVNACVQQQELFNDAVYGYIVTGERVSNTTVDKQHQKRYQQLIDAIHAPNTDDVLKSMHAYLKDWYKKHKGYLWHGSHERFTDDDNGREVNEGYMGYWSFEAAAVVYRLGLDDTELHQYIWYPKDIVAYARTLATEAATEPTIPQPEPPPSRYTGYSVAVGEVCQETGYYECPRLKGRTVMLMQGQPVAGDKHNEMGAIIWYKLTKEAERYYLDNRKKDPFTGNWE